MLTTLLLLAALIQTPPPEPKPVPVPAGVAIDLDGKLGVEEWKDAARQKLGEQGELLLKHDAEWLYLGLRSPTPGLVHVYLFDGEELHAHHASAALGTAIYQKDDQGAWQPTQAFPSGEGWALRDPGLGPESRAARQRFLAESGWVASNITMGRNEFEFVLAKKRLRPTTRLAAAFLAGTSVFPWPPALADDCVKRELLSGRTPPGLSFAPLTWERLEFLPATVPAEK